MDTLNIDSVVYKYGDRDLFNYIIPYLDGEIHGWYYEYYKNGQLRHKEERIKGKTKDGFYQYFDKDGLCSERGYIKNNRAFGSWEIFVNGLFFGVRVYNCKGRWIKNYRLNGSTGELEDVGLY